MRLSRSIMSGIFLFVALTAMAGATPPVAVACSCVMPEPMAVHREDPLKIVFAGTVATAGPAGVNVAVEHWFQGSGDPFVALSPDGFGAQSASCQDPLPPVGSRWIWVAYMPERGALPQVNLCTPKAQLDTPEGELMLAEAVEAFGQGQSPPSQPPDVDPDPAAPTTTGTDVATLVLPLAAAGVVGLLLFGGVFLLGRSRRS